MYLDDGCTYDGDDGNDGDDGDHKTTTIARHYSIQVEFTVVVAIFGTVK